MITQLKGVITSSFKITQAGAMPLKIGGGEGEEFKMLTILRVYPA